MFSKQTSRIINYFGLVVLAFFSVLMLEITWRYVSFDTNASFLQIKQDYISHQAWLTAFYIHVFTSLFALLAGFTQFSATIRQRWPQLHRSVGYVYVVNILLITGPSALLMAFYANGGLSSRLGFFVLAVLWWWFTFQAFRYARQGNIQRHRAYMLRSYALTLSAITLRIWKMSIAHTLALPPMDIYRIVAWLGFVPNLLLVEYWLRRQRF
jgi:uncharacterized membrane protein